MFRAKHLQIGILGEDLAVKFLKASKYRIITRNYRNSWGEIDIISKDKKGTLIFIEVKTLTSYNKEIRQQENGESFLKPEDNLTHAKFQKLQKACLYFANRNPNLINNNKGWQIDLIAISILKKEPDSSLFIPLGVARTGGVSSLQMGLTNNEKDFVIKHYKNIAF